MRLLICFLLFSTLCVGCGGKGGGEVDRNRFAASGSSAGNGSDNPDVGDGSAWFLGKSKKISYCYQVSDGFGASDSEIRQALDAGFSRWAEYILTRNIHMSSISGINFDFPTAAHLLDQCNGTEDVRFYFGGRSSEIDRARAMHKNPTAFALRTAYDPVAGWGKGFVWVAPRASVFPEMSFPDWSSSDELQAIVLHEIGHIYGNGHVDGTIMDSDLSMLLANSPTNLARLNRIDRQRFLTACFDCDLAFPGIFGWKETGADNSAETTFIRFTGRRPQGAIHAQFSTKQLTGTSILVVKDELGSVEIPLRIEEPASPQNIAFDSEGVSFKAYLEQPAGTKTASYMAVSGYVFHGQAFSATGEAIQILLDVNTRNPLIPYQELGETLAGPVNIQYADNGKFLSLFVGQQP